MWPGILLGAGEKLTFNGVREQLAKATVSALDILVVADIVETLAEPLHLITWDTLVSRVMRSPPTPYILVHVTCNAIVVAFSVLVHFFRVGSVLPCYTRNSRVCRTARTGMRTAN